MKRGKKMLLLLAVLVLCVGGYYGVQLLHAGPAPVTEETGSFALDSHGADELAGLTWAAGEEPLTFTREDGTWIVTADPAFPLNQEEMQGMADALLAVSGTRQLDGVTDLAAYGLAEPVFTVTAAWTDGTSTTYALGAETPFGDGYYVSLGHEGVMYTVAEDISRIFDIALNDLAVLETLPAVTGATRLTVGNTLDIVKEDASRTINAGEIWYDSLTGEAVDAAAADGLIAGAQEIAWGELADPTADGDELLAYGLDDGRAVAVTLYEGETAARTLLIGAQNDAGAYYARLPGSTMVYTVAGDALSTLLTATAQTMPSMVILDLAAEKVQSAAFTAGTAAYTWTPVAADASADAAAEDEPPTTAETPDPGADLWADVLALKAEGSIPAAAGNTLLTIEVASVDGLSAVLTFSEHDAAHYTVTVRERCFLVDAADVDAIICSLRTIE